MPKKTGPNATLAQRLGSVAREARTARGLTQAEAAEMVGIAHEVYGRIERGRMLPSVPTLRRMCLVLKVSADLMLQVETTAQSPARAQSPGSASRHRNRIEERLERLPTAQLALLDKLTRELTRPR